MTVFDCNDVYFMLLFIMFVALIVSGFAAAVYASGKT